MSWTRWLASPLANRSGSRRNRPARPPRRERGWNWSAWRSANSSPPATSSPAATYQNTSSGQVLLDTGVKSFTVVNQLVYDLHTDGTVYAVMTGTGVYKLQIGSGYSALVSGNQGSLCALNPSNHDVYLHTYVLRAPARRRKAAHSSEGERTPRAASTSSAARRPW
jgi:hypothetical protein